MSAEEAPEAPPTRMVVMGGSGLAEGFALIGFETWPEATEADVEGLLADLLRRRENALVLLEPELARCDCPSLRRARQESGRVVVVEVPPLHAPGSYRPEVEDLVVRMLGAQALEDPE
jgi:vacuolar-type H+-ATPase subunit F/Vma7